MEVGPIYTSEEILSLVEQNNSSFKLLCLGDMGCQFSVDAYSFNNISDYSRLGTAIAKNTNLEILEVDITHNNELIEGVDAENNPFYDGLKRNSSITELSLHSATGHGFIDMNEVGRQILEAYQKSNHLTDLHIQSVLRADDITTITNTLQWCENLQYLNLSNCGINDLQLRPIVDVLLGLPLLDTLDLDDNRIGNVGCQTISDLLYDSNSNLTDMILRSNNIDNAGAMSFVVGLAHNTKFKRLYLFNNEVDISIEDAFSEALCDTSSINSTFDSNHTFEDLCLENDNEEGHRELYGDHLLSLLTMNECTNKKHVAIKKILRYHPNLDMADLFELDLVAQGERNLKGLPRVIDWFEKAREAVTEEDEEDGGYTVEGRKLSAIYQFVHAMPLQFVPASHREVEDNKKRKRDE